MGQTTSIVQNYQCWKMPGSRLDLEAEIEKAGKEQADIIIAKSIGTVIALNGYKRKLFTAIYTNIGKRSKNETKDTIYANFIMYNSRVNPQFRCWRDR